MTRYVVLQAHDGENIESGVGWGVAHTSSDVAGGEAACYEYLDTLSPAAVGSGLSLATVPLRSWEPAVYRGKMAWSRETIKDGTTPTADDELSMGTLPPEPTPEPAAVSEAPAAEPTGDDDLPLGPPPQPSLLDAPPPGGDLFPGSDEAEPPQVAAAAMFDDTLDT